MKKTSMPNSVKSLGYIKCYSLSSSRPVISPSNSIIYNCQNIWSWSRRSKTILEVWKRPHFSRWTTSTLFKIFSNTLLTTEIRPTGRQFLSIDLSPTFINTGITNETFQQSGKQDSFRHILQNSASMYESSSSQFLRATTGIKLGPDTFDKSRFIMALLTIFGVTKKLYSYRLILERKIGKEVPQSLRLEFLEKFLGNNFTLSNAEDNTSRPKVPIPSFWEKTDSFVLLAYAGSFGRFKNPFATIISLSELYFTFRKFILFVQTRKVISMNYGSSISSWKQWRKVRFDLIFAMRVIYINSNLNPFTKLTSSSRSTQFNDILPWSWTSLKWSRRPSQSPQE